MKKYMEKIKNKGESEENKEEKKEDLKQTTVKEEKKNDTKESKKTESKHSPTEESKKQEEKKEEEKKEEEKKEEEENKEEKKEKKIYDPRLYDTEKMELVDFGEKTYKKLIDCISEMHGIMWLGRLSPSKCENMFDNYITIINKINERKKELKEKFEEDQATEEKKLHETDLKARKQLLNIFLKGQSTYEIIKDNYKLILSGQANPDELGEEDDGGQDEEQFNHDMHKLIDYYINDDFELINSILKGKHISGFYGLDRDNSVEKEEEFDPKSIEEITN
jgi:DNA mismatch repair ATPase MutL